MRIPSIPLVAGKPKGLLTAFLTYGFDSLVGRDPASAVWGRGGAGVFHVHDAKMVSESAA
jgi:hypothetical protein